MILDSVLTVIIRAIFVIAFAIIIFSIVKAIKSGKAKFGNTTTNSNFDDFMRQENRRLFDEQVRRENAEFMNTCRQTTEPFSMQNFDTFNNMNNMF